MTRQTSHVLLAVNGTLTRGLELNPNLLAVHAEFVRETVTAPTYPLWSIDGRHPAMVRVQNGGAAVAVEVWSIPAGGLASILLSEPPGLSIGKVTLDDGSVVLGVLGEPALCEGQKEITEFGGWRAYIVAGRKQVVFSRRRRVDKLKLTPATNNLFAGTCRQFKQGFLDSN